MSVNRLMNVILHGIKHLRDPYYQGFAAMLAFYLLLSIVPIVIIISQLLGLFSVSLERISGWIDIYVQGEAASMLKDIFAYTPSGAMNLVLTVIALWSASRAQFAMVRLTNYTITGGKSTGNGYVKERLRAMKTMVFTIFTVTFALIILVYGESLLQLIAFILTNSVDWDSYISKFWLFIRWPIALLLYYLMISYNYYILPSWRSRYRDIVPGSLFAASGMLFATWVFNVYMSRNISNYGLLYGSLGSIVALLFWFYLLAWIMGLGVIFNKIWLDTKQLLTE